MPAVRRVCCAGSFAAWNGWVLRGVARRAALQHTPSIVHGRSVPSAGLGTQTQHTDAGFYNENTFSLTVGLFYHVQPLQLSRCGQPKGEYRSAQREGSPVSQSEHPHAHPHVHARAAGHPATASLPRSTPAASLLMRGVGGRLLGVGILLALLWLAVAWALADGS